MAHAPDRLPFLQAPMTCSARWRAKNGIDTRNRPVDARQAGLHASGPVINTDSFHLAAMHNHFWHEFQFMSSHPVPATRAWKLPARSVIASLTSRPSDRIATTTQLVRAVSRRVVSVTLVHAEMARIERGCGSDSRCKDSATDRCGRGLTTSPSSPNMPQNARVWSELA